MEPDCEDSDGALGRARRDLRLVECLLASGAARRRVRAGIERRLWGLRNRIEFSRDDVADAVFEEMERLGSRLMACDECEALLKKMAAGVAPGGNLVKRAHELRGEIKRLAGRTTS